MRKEKLEITCQEVEHILINQDIEKISEYDRLLVENHIQKCRECEQYDYILLKIKMPTRGNILNLSLKGMISENIKDLASQYESLAN